jgi:hypothetical protein
MPVFKIKATGKERLKAGQIYVIDDQGKNNTKISLIKGPNMSPSPPVNVPSGNIIPELKPFDSIEDYWSYSITNVRAIGILGQSRSGKTGMAYKILNQYAGPRVICVYQHPNPIEIEKIKNVWGKQFKNVRGLLQLETMNEFIIWIDEPQLHFKNPDDLIRFISVVSHHDGTIIFTSNETRWFAARMEDHIDVWIIKNCYFKTIKRGGVAQDIIKDYFWDDPKKFRLAVD